MLTNFELKQLKPKLDIVKKPENQVHELTDSNVSLTLSTSCQSEFRCNVNDQIENFNSRDEAEILDIDS